MTDVDALEGTVAQRIRLVRHLLAPGELRVVAALTNSYPTAGLVPIAQLAAEADVSAPTALRLVGKLGFAGYGAFQEALRAEVQTRLFSPANVYPDSGGGVGDDGTDEIGLAGRRYADGLRATLAGLEPTEMAAVVAGLSDLEKTVMLVGGRFTGLLATQLFQYLRMLRPGVVLVEPSSADRMVSMIDVDTRTTVFAFDFRRYQHSTIEWGKAATERGAQLMLMTDVYLSPLASHSDTVLTVSHEGPGPFDSMLHGFMLVELLVSLVAKEIGEPAHARLAEFEQLHPAAERPTRRARRK